ncbi:MAG: 3-oxoacyl-[acyl-carrier-protein] synthase III C-terminal domain-containing protein [Bdellovibrionales bacterium]
MYLSRFENLLPTYLVAQADGLKWLSQAHARKSAEISAERFEKLIQRYGCGADQISRRGTFLRDFTHQNWPEMQVFSSGGASLEKRMGFFNEALLPAVEKLYPETVPDFKQWIHVSCTGYVSPSVVQILASTRGWGEAVECLHAYHMGCYAAFPALRMARGNGETDILHTELCTLHLDPSLHEPEQLVIQSLFADGVIRYHAGDLKPSLGFKLEEIREIIPPQTLQQMSWGLSHSQFTMTLAREVPKSVQQSVAAVVRPWQSAEAVYAIHPGGPRIIDAVKEALGLSEEQVHFSREVLRQHGNMSSATLPHVWQRMLSEIPAGAPVISMAFGPGLTISASLMAKVGQ